jgi:hypothetical protein
MGAGVSARGVTADDLRRLADVIGDRLCDAVSVTVHPGEIAVRVRLASAPAGEWGRGETAAEAIGDLAVRVRS